MLVVPSALATVKVSDTAAQRSGCQRPSSPCTSSPPSVPIENVPFAPATFVCATYVCALSTSGAVSVPPVVSAAFVSARLTVTRRTHHRRIVGPVDRHLHRARRPVRARHRELSDTDWPTFRLSNAEFAVYVQVPSAAIENVPFAPATFVCATNAAALSTPRPSASRRS